MDITLRPAEAADAGAVATGNLHARRIYERSDWTDAGPFDDPAATEVGPIPVPCHRYVKDA